jgi:hypothetical protein
MIAAPAAARCNDHLLIAAARTTTAPPFTTSWTF